MKYVLIIDEGKESGAYLMRLLEPLPLLCVLTRSVEGALQLIACEPPDVILLDEGFDVIKGYQLWTPESFNEQRLCRACELFSGLENFNIGATPFPIEFNKPINESVFLSVLGKLVS